MKVILESDETYIEAKKFMELAAEQARKSPCLKAHCGAVIVKDGQVIGQGFNSPSADDRLRCEDNYVFPENNKHDVTCCIHAEVRAIHEAFKNHPEKLQGATLYFMRTNSAGEQTFAGVPFCTICSKEALDAGLAEFVLWHKTGITVYNTKEYNEASYQYFKDSNLWQLK